MQSKKNTNEQENQDEAVNGGKEKVLVAFRLIASSIGVKI
jgi:hypothetical protein